MSASRIIQRRIFSRNTMGNQIKCMSTNELPIERKYLLEYTYIADILVSR